MRRRPRCEALGAGGSIDIESEPGHRPIFALHGDPAVCGRAVPRRTLDRPRDRARARPALPGRSRRRGSAGTWRGCCRSSSSSLALDVRRQASPPTGSSRPRLARRRLSQLVRRLRPARRARRDHGPRDDGGGDRARGRHRTRPADGHPGADPRLLRDLPVVTKLHARLHRDARPSSSTKRDVGRGDRYIDQFFRLPDGRLVGWKELDQIDPSVVERARRARNTRSSPSSSRASGTGRSRRARRLLLGGIAVVMLAGTARHRPAQTPGLSNGRPATIARSRAIAGDLGRGR